MRLHLLCLLLSTVMQQSQQQEGRCLSIKVRSQYYQLSTLRQFPNMQPEWVRLQNGLAYYTLNGKTFNIARQQQNDTVVSDITAPYAASVEDEHRNKVFQRGYNAYVYIAKFNREYLLVTDGQENNFKFVLDPIQNIVFMISSSNNQPYGKMFWFSLRRYESENNSIEANQVTDFNSSLTSIDLNPSTGNILVSGRRNSIGEVYFMQQLRDNPCGNNETSSDQIKDDLFKQLTDLLKQTVHAYKDVVLKNGTIVCVENEYSELDGLTHRSNKERAPNSEISRERQIIACRDVQNFQRTLTSDLQKINKILISKKSKNEHLKNELELTKVKMQDLTGKLHRLTQTALFDKPVTGSYFNTQRSPADIPEYDTNKYVCIMKDELANKQDKLDMYQQLKVLKESLQSIEQAMKLTG